MIFRFYILLITISMAPACTARTPHSATFTATNAAPRDLRARSTDSVAVFITGNPGDEYVEVGTLTAGAGEEGLALQALRQHAADVGCDGVIVTSMRQDLPFTHTRYHGVCFLYAQDKGTWAPPPQQRPDQAAGPQQPAQSEPAGNDCEGWRARIRATTDPRTRMALIRKAPPDCMRQRSTE